MELREKVFVCNNAIPSINSVLLLANQLKARDGGWMGERGKQPKKMTTSSVKRKRLSLVSHTHKSLTKLMQSAIHAIYTMIKN
jgi:hypothetical protein